MGCGASQPAPARVADYAKPVSQPSPAAAALPKGVNQDRRGSVRRVAVSAENTGDVNVAMVRKERKMEVQGADEAAAAGDATFRKYAKPLEPKSAELLERLRTMTAQNPLFSGSAETLPLLCMSPLQGAARASRPQRSDPQLNPRKRSHTTPSKHSTAARATLRVARRHVCDAAGFGVPIDGRDAV